MQQKWTAGKCVWEKLVWNNHQGTCFPPLSQKTLWWFENPVSIWLQVLQTTQIFMKDHSSIVHVNGNETRISALQMFDTFQILVKGKSKHCGLSCFSGYRQALMVQQKYWAWLLGFEFVLWYLTQLFLLVWLALYLVDMKNLWSILFDTKYMEQALGSKDDRGDYWRCWLQIALHSFHHIKLLYTMPRLDKIW